MLPSISIIFVEGTGTDRCKIKWWAQPEFQLHLSPYQIYLRRNSSANTAVSKIEGDSKTTHAVSLSPAYKTLYINQEADSTYLYKDFYIKEGEKKAILDVIIHSSDRSTDSLIPKMFKLRILKIPAGYIRGKDGRTAYVMTHVIFTPIDGIFSETTPPNKS